MEHIEEGKARIFNKNVVGKIEPTSRKRNSPEETSPSSKTVNTLFYNPAQVFNRDLSLIVIKVFGQQRLQSAFKKYEDAANKVRVPEDVKGLNILEPLAATGLRSLRYCLELPQSMLRSVTTSDIDPAAVEGAAKNRELNGISDSVMKTVCADATELMHAGRFICGTSQWDVVDIDPYGTATPFIEGAVRAVKDGGLLCVTSTDMPVLGGNSPDVAFYKYGGSTVKARYLHEMALRLVIHQLQMTAAKSRRYVVPLLSLSVDFYVRIFVQVWDKPALCSSLATQTATVLQCSNCDHFATVPFGHYVEQKSVHPQKKRRCDRSDSPSEEITDSLPSEDAPTTAETHDSSVEETKTPLHTCSLFPTELKGNRRFVLGRVPQDTPRGACVECGSQVIIAGPFYAGPLHDAHFLAACISEIEKAKGTSESLNILGDSVSIDRKLIEEGSLEKGEGDGDALAWVDYARKSFESEMASFRFDALAKNCHDKILGVLTACKGELPDVPLFYKLPSICNKAKLDMIKMDRFKSALLHLGYRVGLFHREPLSIKTDAPASVIFDLVRAWVRKQKTDGPGPNKLARVPPNFLKEPPSDFHADFSYHPSLVEKKDRNPKWVPNPTPNWGPGRRAGRG